ncbi:CUGBP Elav-like member 2 [Asimina triloba]
MPDEGRRVLNLMHELKPIEGGDRSAEISVDVPDMAEVLERKGAGVVDAPFAVLVLVQPAGRGREWALQELEIVEVLLASEARNAFKKVMSHGSCSVDGGRPLLPEARGCHASFRLIADARA